jgi:hypothetical protein
MISARERITCSPIVANYYPSFEAELSGHREWLLAVGEPDRLSQWEARLQDQPEPAICEALVRHLIASRVDEVLPGEDLATGGPDFLCLSRGERFYVESTCMLTSAVTAATGISPYPESGFSTYGLLAAKFRDECRAKTMQCSMRKDGPCVLAISTLHRIASEFCFDEQRIGFILTSEPLITGDYDEKAGEVRGELYQSTNWSKSAFLRRSKADPLFLEEASRPVSAMLLCGFGGVPAKVSGVLHPNPVRPFSPTLLPGLRFSRLRENGDGTIEVVAAN